MNRYFLGLNILMFILNVLVYAGMARIARRDRQRQRLLRDLRSRVHESMERIGGR